MGDRRPSSAASWALASCCVAVLSLVTGLMMLATRLTIWLPKKVRMSQKAMTTRAAVAARRKTTEARVARASQKAT